MEMKKHFKFYLYCLYRWGICSSWIHVPMCFNNTFNFTSFPELGFWYAVCECAGGLFAGGLNAAPVVCIVPYGEPAGARTLAHRTLAHRTLRLCGPRHGARLYGTSSY